MNVFCSCKNLRRCCSSVLELAPLGKPLMFAAYLHLYNMQVLHRSPQEYGHSNWMIHQEGEKYRRILEKLQIPTYSWGGGGRNNNRHYCPYNCF
jgi:hypothetical protein